MRDLSSQNSKSRYNNKKVIKLDTQGNKIRVFKNANFAAKLCHIAADNLNHCLKGRTHSAGGYLWCYEDEIKDFDIPERIFVSHTRELDILLGLK